MIRSPIISVMTEAVTKAARSLVRDFGEVENLQVSLKGPGDFVSAADRKAEKILYESLARARPGYGFVMEEAGVVQGSDETHRWHIDPLDGTSNFLHAIPHFAVSVGLEREGQLIAGVIYDVVKDEMFVAEKGKGAFVNNRRLRVSARREPTRMLIGTGVPHIGKPGHPRFLSELGAVMSRFSNVRRMGAASLDMAYVAAGRLDAYWERGLNSWDVAAGIVLVREAGGTVTALDGRADLTQAKDLICGNEVAERELTAALKAAV